MGVKASHSIRIFVIVSTIIISYLSVRIDVFYQICKNAVQTYEIPRQAPTFHLQSNLTSAPMPLRWGYRFQVAVQPASPFPARNAPTRFHCLELLLHRKTPSPGTLLAASARCPQSSHMEPPTKIRPRAMYLAFDIVKQASPLLRSSQRWVNRSLLQVCTVPEEEQVEYCLGEEIAL
jgi:hypothetical protein